MDEQTLGRKLIEWAAKSLNVSCYDREDYGYCVFCNEEQPAWDVGITHKPDCLHVQAKALLASADGAEEG